ncbi:MULTISPECIES: DUF2207 domain-containing protein [Methanoculleus]|uniref:DUF2207 domain-containing protein n=2 Tax=Methanoculleus TaxID=45989 RepID=A3CYD5_METMJ|nr:MULTISPECIES: DUF2207 domain-containing protein [Methanoculleus]ABN58385.1 conserved hypothetical protein [Methanoculleus marisnigri JR1]MCC7554625.1 DUF2207 domain-containing protein [Methanoculleus marisnigri]UYU17383.1 DUF2207 domain-containing protein [Methanoculleus submarinus]
MRITERQQILTLLAVTLVIGVLAVVGANALPALFRGNLEVEQYEAVFCENGTLVERYTYDVRAAGEYRMLFRYWDAPLAFSAIDRPHIEFAGMAAPPGTIGYVKDHWGEVRPAAGSPTTSDIAAIRNLAFDSEVGLYNPDYFAPGTYTVEYRYIVRPPIEYDEEWAHLNLKLVDEHVSFRNLRVTLPFAGQIEEVYTHPPTLEVERTAESVVVTGAAPQDDALNIEMVLDPAFMEEIDGFPGYVPDVRQQAADANRWPPILYAAAKILYGLATVLVLAMPFILLGVYLRYGREKPFTVPEYLSFTPNTALKPWQVNLLFKGDALDYDENGFYATILDLHRQKKIVVTEKPDGKGVTVRIVSGVSSDPYEQRVLNFLGNIADDHVVDTAELEEFARTARRSPGYQHRIVQYQQSLAGLTRDVDTSLAHRYIKDGRTMILPLVFLGAIPCGLSILAFILAPGAANLLIPAGTLAFIAAVQVGIAAIFPSTLFGFWKGDHYKEKLEWDAFSYFLSDLALIRQYSPADLSMWGEWLVYGTALGIGDKVEQAMKNLHINIPDVGVPLYSNMPVIFAPIVLYSPPSSGGGSGGFGGGGSFGGGGGFGGGGVGGR